MFVIYMGWANVVELRMHQIVNFIIQKLNNKHTSLKKYTNSAKLSSLILTEREETKTRYFAPECHLHNRFKIEFHFFERGKLLFQSN